MKLETLLCGVASRRSFLADQGGASSEVFKLALAVIICAAVLAVIASMFAGLWPATKSSVNTTATALVNLSQKLKDRVAAF